MPAYFLEHHQIILYHSQKLEWQGKRVKVLRLVG